MPLLVIRKLDQVDKDLAPMAIGAPATAKGEKVLDLGFVVIPSSIAGLSRTRILAELIALAAAVLSVGAFVAFVLP